MKYNIEEMRKHVHKRLTDERYYHSLGVSHTASALAMRYGLDIENAQVAGLLHDCAKELTLEKMTLRCEAVKEPISTLEATNVKLLHSKAGAAVAMKDFGIADFDLLNAIRYHTTGRPGMSVLEKFIYISDYIEPDRWDKPMLTEIRQASFEDIDKGLLMILKNSMKHLAEGKRQIDPMTAAAYEYYKGVLL